MDKLQTIMLKMDQTIEGRRVLRQLEAKRFILSLPEDFSEVFKMAAEAGMQKQGQVNAPN